MDLKRKATDGALVPVKKPKNELVAQSSKNAVTEAGVPRTSSLLAPIMLLTGHEAEVLTAKFSPDGNFICSAGHERLIYMWNTYEECENFHIMKGHSGAIMQLCFNPDGGQIATASTDKTLGLWDLQVGERIRKFKSHTTFVNACDLARRGPQMLCSGSDDGTIKLWDARRKNCVHTFQNTYQVLGVRFSDTAEQLITGGIDNVIKVWDLRKKDLVYGMQGHTDSVTGLSLSPDGSYLLSTAMDDTVRIWDVRPFAPQERCVKILQGNKHTFEKNLLRCAWSPDGSKVSAGSGDRYVYVWDTTSRRILYKLPGHSGSVNDVDFHPVEPIVLSAASDKKIYLGEID